MASPLATMYGASIGAGTPQPPFRAQIQPTDVEKAYSDYNNTMMQAYAAKLGQQNAMWGGLAGLGGAGISVLPKLLGGAAGGSGIASSFGLGDLAASEGLSDADMLASILAVA